MSEPVDQLVCRDGESERVWARMNRFYQVGDDWYFSTRESDDIGPFRTRAQAQAAVANYLADVYDSVSSNEQNA